MNKESVKRLALVKGVDMYICGWSSFVLVPSEAPGTGRYKNYSYTYSTNTMEPLNKGHLRTEAIVPYSEVVPYWEVFQKVE